MSVDAVTCTDCPPVPQTGCWVIFTDLDGTLLEHENYSYEAAKVALGQIRSRHIPLILNSSKTLAELYSLAIELDIQAPLLAENGSVIAWPGPTGFRIECTGRADYAYITGVLDQLRKQHDYHFMGFHDWTAAEIADKTGLAFSAAQRAGQRQGSEPLLWEDSPVQMESFRQQLLERGLLLKKGGRFWHVMGQTDKVAAMQRVVEVYRQQRQQEMFVVALGDGPNDRDMLAAADAAVVVHNPHTNDFDLPARDGQVRLQTVLPGPAGWNEALLALLAVAGR
ncbi:MAG: HAD-IIB family hydrolase [Gammaproteobacteria bacterium]|nr:HAD-IIB family hydrolase [Gammaproteobacteria bacterium]